MYHFHEVIKPLLKCHLEIKLRSERKGPLRLYYTSKSERNQLSHSRACFGSASSCSHSCSKCENVKRKGGEKKNEKKRNALRDQTHAHAHTHVLHI